MQNPSARLEAKVVRKVSDIPRPEWDRLFPAVIDDYDFFRTLDESGFGQFEFFYIVVNSPDGIAAIAPCFTMDYPLDTSAGKAIKSLIAFIRKFLPKAFVLKTVICGVPIGQGNIGVRAQSPAILQAICRGMESIAGRHRSNIMAFKDFNRSYSALLSPLVNDGFIKLDSLPTAEMAISFSGFEEYLARLSHKTRYDLRRKFKKVDGRVKIEMEVTSSPDEKLLNEIYELYRGMVRRHDMGFEVAPVEFFRNVSAFMPGKAKFFLWRMDGRLVAFVFALVSGSFFSAYYLGLDYSVAEKYHLYFIRFRDIINWCLKNGIKRYDVGVTGYEPKKRLGFDFLPLDLYVKHLNPAMRPLFRAMCSFLKFENSDPVLEEIRRKRRE